MTLKVQHLLSNRRYLLIVIIGLVAVLICMSIAFRLSLISIDPNSVESKTAFEPLYVDSGLLQTQTAADIKQAWYERQSSNVDFEPPLASMAESRGMQVDDPGEFADLIIVGTYTGESHSAYKALVSDIEVKQVISPMDTCSKLTRSQKQYDIPKFDIREGSHLKIYEEFSIVPSTDYPNMSYLAQRGAANNRFTYFLPPLRKDQSYLFFLNYVPKDVASPTLETARFKFAPTIYSRIAIPDATSSERIFKENLPTNNEGQSEAAPFNTTSTNSSNADFEKQYQDASAQLQSFSLQEARNYDLFVDNDSTAHIYLEQTKRILNQYGL